MVQYGKGLISVFPAFFASITKISFWHGNWALGYRSKKFSRYFVRHLVMQLKPCLLLIITLRSLVAKGKFGKISKFQNIMKMIIEASVTNYYYYYFLLLFIN